MDSITTPTVFITDAVGKTIERVYHQNETVLIRYTDGTFSYLTSCFVFEETIIENQPIRMGGYPHSDLAIEFGCYTQKEYDDWEQAVEAQRAQETLAEKRRQYEELRKLFE